MARAKLFVGQVPAIYSENELRPVFAEYGQILDLAILRDKMSGQSKGAAFVTYSSREAADNAISTLHNQMVLPPQNTPLQVKYADNQGPPPAGAGGGAGMPPGMPAHYPHPHGMGAMHGMGMPGGFPPAARPTPQPQAQNNKGGRKTFFGQLPKTWTEEQVRELASPYGTVTEVFVLVEKPTGQGKGAAFVVFSTPAEAKQAVQGLHQSTTLEGSSNPLHVTIAAGEVERNECKLFVGKLPKTVAEDEVQSLFVPYGSVSEVAILRKGGVSNGAAFVKFETAEEAQNAITNLHDTSPFTGAGPIVVKLADSDGDKRRQNQPPAYPAGMPPYGGHHHAPMYPHQYPHHQGNQPYGHGQMGGYNMGGPGMGGPGMGGPGMAPASVQVGASGRNPQQTGPAGANLFVLHIPPHLLDHDLKALFDPHGHVLSAKVFIDKVTGHSKGFGFVSYANAQQAQQAIGQLNGMQMPTGERLKVQLKQGDGQGQKPY